jgi:hypothetical protein
MPDISEYGGATMAGDTPERALELARLEQIQLENNKLKLELAELRKRKSWSTQMVPIITALVAAGGLLIGVSQFVTDQATQHKQEQETANRQIMQPWLDSQRDFYQQALSAASTAITSGDPKKKRQATEEFWQLYYGKMILVETESVSTLMVTLGKCLNGSDPCSKVKIGECPNGSDPCSKHDLLLGLGTAMAKSMADTARMTYKQFSDNQFKYSP